MAGNEFMERDDFNLDDLLTFEVVAETVGARAAMVSRLANQGLIETVETETGELLLPRRAILRLRRMHRLRRDLGVNLTGAAIILDLVWRMEQLNRELAELRNSQES
jgi:DNA-binding transcriptional MerR regulator